MVYEAWLNQFKWAAMKAEPASFSFSDIKLSKI